MPGWLQPVARNNPFTIATNACRALYNGLPVGNDAILTIVWSIGITLVFASMSIRKFSSSTVA
jgi:ABC-type multidrug transport system permease subunit